ncbi:Rpn family recombination-promoting nuclease/putative transposase, partial [Salmonella enterica subsp. enterica serovar Pomona]
MRTTPEQPPEEMAIPFTANVSFSWAVITSPGHFPEPGLMKKKNSTPTPHDATFRQFLTQPDIARDFMEIVRHESRLCNCFYGKYSGRNLMFRHQ